MSSKKMRRNFRRTPSNIRSIRLWNVQGALVRPKGITRFFVRTWVCLERCLVDVIRWHAKLVESCSKIQLGKVLSASKLIKQVLSSGIGYLSLMVCLFSPWKSKQSLHVRLSFWRGPLERHKGLSYTEWCLGLTYHGSSCQWHLSGVLSSGRVSS